MPLRFQRRIRISPGISLNFNKKKVRVHRSVDPALTSQLDQKEDEPLSVCLEPVCHILAISRDDREFCWSWESWLSCC